MARDPARRPSAREMRDQLAAIGQRLSAPGDDPLDTEDVALGNTLDTLQPNAAGARVEALVQRVAEARPRPSPGPSGQGRRPRPRPAPSADARGERAPRPEGSSSARRPALSRASPAGDARTTRWWIAALGAIAFAVVGAGVLVGAYGLTRAYGGPGDERSRGGRPAAGLPPLPTTERGFAMIQVNVLESCRDAYFGGADEQVWLLQTTYDEATNTMTLRRWDETNTALAFSPGAGRADGDLLLHDPALIRRGLRLTVMRGDRYWSNASVRRTHLGQAHGRVVVHEFAPDVGRMFIELSNVVLYDEEGQDACFISGGARIHRLHRRFSSEAE
jgi:hypothetical protein